MRLNNFYRSFWCCRLTELKGIYCIWHLRFASLRINEYYYACFHVLTLIKNKQTTESDQPVNLYSHHIENIANIDIHNIQLLYTTSRLAITTCGHKVALKSALERPPNPERPLKSQQRRRLRPRPAQ